MKLQQRFKSEVPNVYILEINKIALSSNDDKRLQTFDRVTSYHRGTRVRKVCKTELLSKYKPYRILIIGSSGSGKIN